MELQTFGADSDVFKHYAKRRILFLIRMIILPEIIPAWIADKQMTDWWSYTPVLPNTLAESNTHSGHDTFVFTSYFNTSNFVVHVTVKNETSPVLDDWHSFYVIKINRFQKQMRFL